MEQANGGTRALDDVDGPTKRKSGCAGREVTQVAIVRRFIVECRGSDKAGFLKSFKKQYVEAMEGGGERSSR